MCVCVCVMNKYTRNIAENIENMEALFWLYKFTN